MRGAILFGVVLFTGVAHATPIEGDVQAGLAFANLPGVYAPAIAARVAADPIDHLSLGVRGFLIIGDGPDYTATTHQFRGWGAFLDARVHTGTWLSPVRIDLAAEAGLGREIAAGAPAAESQTFEAARTGLTVAGSVAVRVRVESLLVGVEASPFYWKGQRTDIGAGYSNPNGAARWRPG